MNTELLLDGQEFWARLEGDIARAGQRVWVQTLSFEGDPAGLGLADALCASPATDKRVLVDSFNRLWQSDRFLYLPGNLLAPELRREVHATEDMLAALETDGVAVRHGAPLGALLRRLPSRDHKKLILVDSEVAYIGGINFSDHNFAWHDLMIRIEDRSAAEWLAGVFLAGWEDREVEAGRSFGDAEIFALDGRKNEATFEPILSLLAGARDSIDIVSPYLTFPFCGVLRSAVERGVRVRILTPQNNNRGFLWRYVSFESRRSGFQLRLFPGRMNHMKAILVDGHSLVLGSSNFDWLTYRHMGEIVAVFRQPDLIETFRERVLEPDFSVSLPADGRVGQVRGLLAAAFVRLQAGLAARFCPPRTDASSKTPRRPFGTLPGVEQPAIQLHAEGRLQ